MGRVRRFARRLEETGEIEMDEVPLPFETLFLVEDAAGAINGAGNNVQNFIYGNSGNNALSGYGGDDVLVEGRETRVFARRHPDDPARIEVVAPPADIRRLLG